MPEDTISTETQESIQSFCRKVTVAYDLDEEIQKELYGHIEDKLHCYLDGEEKLSEEDALVLVREHFGKPEHIRNLLEVVHGAQAKGSLARRIGAVVIATMGVELLLPVLNELHYILPYIDRLLFSVSQDRPGSNTLPIYPLNTFISLAGTIAIPLLLWYIIVRWQKHVNSGESIWFFRYKTYILAGIFACLFFLQSFSPALLKMDRFNLRSDRIEGNEPANKWESDRIAFSPAHGFDYHYHNFPGPFNTRFLQSGWHYNHYFFSMVYFALIFLAWLWWCDTPQRRIRSLVYTLGVWLLYSVGLALVLPMIRFRWNPQTIQINMHVFFRIFYISNIQGIIVFSIMILSTLIMSLLLVMIYMTLAKLKLLETRTSLALKLQERIA